MQILNQNFSDPTTIFTDPRWKRFWLPETEPHEVAVCETPTGKVAVLMQKRKKQKEQKHRRTTRFFRRDWALNAKALEYVKAALQERHTIIKAWVAQVGDGGVFRYRELAEVIENIGDTPPGNGEFGEFWWLDDEFRPVRRGRSDDDDDAIPF